MFTKRFIAAIVAASALGGVGLPAMAQEGTQDDFMILFKMDKLDANKDGMVSKQEFMAMMDKAFDMHVKSAGAKGAQLTEPQMMEFMKRMRERGR